jgi:hypothetical protein
MASTQFPLSLIVNISVSQSPTGVSVFNSGNLALFTTDTPSPAFTNGYGIFLDPTDVATAFGSNSVTYSMALAIFSQVPNILLPGGYLVIIPFESSETWAAAITRTLTLVQYFGVMTTQIESSVDALAAAAVIQANTLIGYTVQNTVGAITSVAAALVSASLTQTRCLYYQDTTNSNFNALGMMAAYASRGQSTVYSGSNTTLNMSQKVLAGVATDPNLTPTNEVAANVAGADCYISFQGQPGLYVSGANDFYDNQINLQWFKAALQVAYFNYLGSTSTKIPQTEQGMTGIKNAIQQVCQQAVNNGYLAPGTWNSATTFGNQASLITNVSQFGFYIYSTPIAQQSQSDRANRKAPIIQIAAKLAGGIDTGTVIVSVNQ